MSSGSSRREVRVVGRGGVGRRRGRWLVCGGGCRARGRWGWSSPAVAGVTVISSPSPPRRPGWGRGVVRQRSGGHDQAVDHASGLGVMTFGAFAA